MPAYRYVGGYPRALLGLQQGVNAHHDGTPYGATVEALPGDEVTTDKPYEHAELEPIADDEPGPDAAVELAELTGDAPEDPAHTDMTAEGAPAPETKE